MYTVDRPYYSTNNKAYIMNDLTPISLAIFALLFFFLQVLILRWIFRINDIIFYLDKINEKLFRLLEEKEAGDNI